MSLALYDLGKVPWADSQLLYHAMARLGRQGLALVSPASPYVCVGFHQDAAQEVDLDHCRQAGLPVFRREVGGGAVYLDGRQYFFQIVLRRDNPLIPARRDEFYARFLAPVARAYGRIGVEARLKPVNDLLCGQRKVCGSGAGEIGESVVFVGNMIMDFDCQAMARVLRAPDEKFRDKAQKTMEANMGSIRGLLGSAADRWTEGALNQIMAEEFAKLLGPLEPARPDQALRAEMDRLAQRMLAPQWLLRGRRPSAGRRLKIRAGLELVQRLHKAPGGLLRLEMELRDGRIGQARLSGDFFAYPPQAVEALEAALEGAGRDDLPTIIHEFVGQNQLPGVGAQDWLTLLAF
ncbi:biotin/lipoate A/B protein ligase [Desulfarculus baarsii DSM 2075]|uniref:Biotin/lipoate A/B protein ligase n=1 Tax=Desulfarculus baarsii (strain ATCC 33931 / DSM 2075 / LMG 7858 / VKM B-1802 / 2st14) TaxID=644282 RepID=E1QKY0_DESB2|nr:lipoate--protein ligase [Desulfarculus baarsii]ADK86339.1 biotin/lipoate A/B protein ligase [Desulfarculus baarsii DSM 2075]